MSPTRTILVIFSIALACALAATPLARKCAQWLGFFDQPLERKYHRTPIPMLGGVAMYTAVLISIVLYGHHYMSELIGILTAATLMALLGLTDDRLQLKPILKAMVQLGIVIGLILIVDIRIQLGWIPYWANILLTLFWLLGITNAINLLDNMDGLSGGISAIAAAYFTVIAAINGQFMVSSLAAALLGACIGFLFFNTKPASVYMGDAGSLFLGILLAIIGIKLRFEQNSNFVTWMVPVLVMGIPIFDTTLVVISRLRRGVNPFTTPGTDHTSHRLVRTGHSELEAVLMIYVAACFCGLVSIFLMQATVKEGYQVGAFIAVIMAWLIWKLDYSKA